MNEDVLNYAKLMDFLENCKKHKLSTFFELKELASVAGTNDNELLNVDRTVDLSPRRNISKFLYVEYNNQYFPLREVIKIIDYESLNAEVPFHGLLVVGEF